LWPDFYQSWDRAERRLPPPHFWPLFQANEREQLRGTIDDCIFDTSLIDVVCFCVAEQELELHLSDSTIDKIAFAVEPRQLALNVRVTLCCIVATYIDRVVVAAVDL
jgi:hypothetical protein